MKFVYILESDPKFTKEILEALNKIDPQLQARIFTRLQEFAAWIQLLSQEGTLAIAKGGQPTGSQIASQPSSNDQLVLLVSDNSLLGSKHLPLIKKTQDMFIQKGLCTKDDPTAIVITAFDNPDFDIETVEDRFINNVIFKPFDKMILQQHLILAIGGRHPASSFTLHNMKTSAVVEMLKDVEVETYSDVGFFTTSTRPVPIGAVTKYYGDVFKSGNTRSVFAHCILSEPHPDDPSVFRCGFSYFATYPEQISTFRKNTQTNKEPDFDFYWHDGDPDDYVNLVFIDDEEFGPAPLSGTMDRFFTNAHVVRYKTINDFYLDLDPLLRMNSKKPEKAFPVEGKFKIVFDSQTHKVIRTEPDITVDQTIFGMSETEFYEKDFFRSLDVENRIKLESMIKGDFIKTSDGVINVKHNSHEFFIKHHDHKVTVDKKGQAVSEIEFVELTDPEKAVWLQGQSKLPKVIHGVVVHEVFADPKNLQIWEELRSKLVARALKADPKLNHRPLFSLLARKKKDDHEIRSLGSVFGDVFYKPVDRSYFAKKMYLFFPGLVPRDDIEIKQFHKREKIEVGNPIQITQISEAGLVMNYYRPITIGSFRKFVLWFPIEIGQPVMLATCNYAQESQTQKGVFDNHFVFFGIQDLYLQHVRLWIRDNYVQAKLNEGG